MSFGPLAIGDEGESPLSQRSRAPYAARLAAAVGIESRQVSSVERGERTQLARAFEQLRLTGGPLPSDEQRAGILAAIASQLQTAVAPQAGQDTGTDAIAHSIPMTLALRAPRPIVLEGTLLDVQV